jgi:predicted nucleic-acid-binding protein
VISLDTNLLVRMIDIDSPEQAAIVTRLLAENTVLVTKTVLLETEWVLRSRYKFSPEKIADFFTDVTEARDTIIEEAAQVAQAMGWYRLGADFADPLHLASSAGATLHTFDRDFCKAARRQGIVPEIRILSP